MMGRTEPGWSDGKEAWKAVDGLHRSSGQAMGAWHDSAMARICVRRTLTWCDTAVSDVTISPMTDDPMHYLADPNQIVDRQLPLSNLYQSPTLSSHLI